MIKWCLKLIKINGNVLKCARIGPGRGFCSNNGANAEKTGKIMYLRKYRKLVSEVQLIRLENRFQDQRYDKLSPINASDYKKWLITICFDSENSSLTFERKFERIQRICRIYNDILKKTFRVPSRLTTDLIQDLMEVDADEDIADQINHLYGIEMKRWTEKEVRKEDVIKTREKLELKHRGRTSRIGIFDDKNEIIYGLWHNSLFTRITPKSRKNYILRTRLKNSALFQQKIVIDFGFEEFLNKISSKQLMSYLVKMLSFNKYNLEEPFDICFNNFESSGFLMKLMDNYFQKHDLSEYYIDMKGDSYLNHFNSADLCYICPQADKALVEYDHNMVYILPGVVHNLMNPPLSLMRVKHEGIQMRRIPLEDYRPIRSGFCLEIPNTLQILSHLRDYNDMSKAIELYLPKTVWMDDQEVEDEDKDFVKKIFYQKMIGSQRKAKLYQRTDD